MFHLYQTSTVGPIFCFFLSSTQHGSPLFIQLMFLQVRFQSHLPVLWLCLTSPSLSALGAKTNIFPLKALLFLHLSSTEVLLFSIFVHREKSNPLLQALCQTVVPDPVSPPCCPAPHQHSVSICGGKHSGTL